MVETEYKLLLTQQKYDDLMKQLVAKAPYKKKIQINYYYDTDNLDLYQIGNSLRTRQVDSVLKLQYKEDKEKKETGRTSVEHEVSVLYLPPIISASRFATIPLSYSEYNYIGNLVTERTEFDYYAVKIMLDKNMYLGRNDFEIEIEYSNIKHLYKVFTDLHLSLDAHNHMPGKYSRFIMCLDQFRN